MTQGEHLVDPMTIFYAAVTAVENGSVKEIELEFVTRSEEREITMSMTIRSELHPNAVFMPIVKEE